MIIMSISFQTIHRQLPQKEKRKIMLREGNLKQSLDYYKDFDFRELVE